MKVWPTVLNALEAHGRCAMVTVAAVEGSAPREAGARMIATADGFHGTIGGGSLEWQALASAQRGLSSPGASVKQSRHALGPELGQCCGGQVTLLTETFGREALAAVRALAERERLGPFVTRGRIGQEAMAREIVEEADSGMPVRIVGETVIERFGERVRPLLLFGAGHVGRALVLALAPLPFAVTWVDSRANAFPAHMPGNVTPVRTNDPAGELASAPRTSFVLIMTHSHALDLEITLAALAAARFPYVGLIGSATKRARFAKRLAQANVPQGVIERLVCPIGVRGIGSKLPAAIAAATAAELLILDEALERANTAPGLALAAGA